MGPHCIEVLCIRLHQGRALMQPRLPLDLHAPIVVTALHRRIGAQAHLHHARHGMEPLFHRPGQRL